MDNKTYSVVKNGFYGRFGGAFVPQHLQHCIKEMQDSYSDIIESDDFQQEYNTLLKDYAGHPTPLYHAKKMSERYNCHIYLKREDLNHTGAHKINNTIGQILLAKRLGKKRVIAETGAGQHGVATATVCALMGMECKIYMGKVDIERQYMNVQRMKMLGAIIHPATSGSMTLSDAVNEAFEDWNAHQDDTYYLVGSAVGPHPYPDIVAKMQSVISKEIKSQLKEKINRDYPDYLVACIGGGSNAAGTIYHYMNDDRVQIYLAEGGGKGVDSGQTAATINTGSEGILHGSRTIVMQTKEGKVKDAYSISAGLDYPGVGPLHAYMAKTGRTHVLAINDDEAVYAGYELTRTEGIIPAIESAHAIAALKKMPLKPSDIVVVTVSGRGDKDLDTYLAHKDMAREYGDF